MKILIELHEDAIRSAEYLADCIVYEWQATVKSATVIPDSEAEYVCGKCGNEGVLTCWCNKCVMNHTNI